MNVEPIGYFHAQEEARYALPRQPGVNRDNSGKIVLNPQKNFEQALEDLAGFERIWVVFWFHKNENWKPKVLPPRGEKKRGVFATRSPHRPNPIGLSCLELKEIKGLELHVSNHDLLDQTPILDIKPYLPYADAFPLAKQGWLETLEAEVVFDVQWSLLVQDQLTYLQAEWEIDLKEGLEFSLKHHRSPHQRVKKNAEEGFELRFKSWRVAFQLHEKVICVDKLYSGYDEETLLGQKPSEWDDVPVHISFLSKYPS